MTKLFCDRCDKEILASQFKIWENWVLCLGCNNLLLNFLRELKYSQDMPIAGETKDNSNVKTSNSSSK